MSMRVRILGSGEAFDSVRGNSSCVLLGTAIPTVLFDCGYQVPERLWRLEGVYPEIDAVWLSHHHADHMFGIVPLLTRYWEEQRTRPLHILGPIETEDRVRHLMNLGYPGIMEEFPFEIAFHDLKPGNLAHIGGLAFRCERSLHSVENLSVRVTNIDGQTVGISGDGMMTEETEHLFSGVHLLLHEVYSPQHYQKVPHSSLSDLTKYASSEHGKTILKIGVTHVSRNHHDEMELLVQEMATHDPRWFMAEPDTEIEVGRGVVMRLVS